MDSYPASNLDRPRVTFLEPQQFAGLFGYSEKKQQTDFTPGDGFIPVIQRQFNLGIRYPKHGYPEIAPCGVKIPVNVVSDSKDPMSFGVYSREGRKRKRDQHDHCVLTLRVMHFQTPRQELAILDELQRQSKRNRSVEHWCHVQWPVLQLWVEEDHPDYYIINGKVVFQLWYKNAPLPPALMQEIPGIRKLMEHVVPCENSEAVTPQMLYHCMSERHNVNSEEFKVPGLECELLRYQRQSVRWLLQKEGKCIGSDGQVQSYTSGEHAEWHSFGNYLCNPYSGCITEKKLLQEENTNVGAQLLLAEEMGLGKTVETIAVILLNPRPRSVATVYDWTMGRDIIAAKTTLIISPQSIAQQWKDEVEMHSPELSVLVYHGRGEGRGDEVARKLASYDVVITNYRTISQEVHYALYNPPDRVRSHVAQKRDVEGIQSPLVQVQFWRVILDEVQMVSSAVSDSARVARMIPRVHAWGVSGTPVNRSLKDLRGLMNFLRYEPYASSNHAWKRFSHSAKDFERLFTNIGIRHTTAMVEHDISIPPQTRVLVPLAFNQIEADNYQRLYEEFLNAYALDSAGNMISQYSVLPDSAHLSQWLMRLRQSCCHVRIGVNKRTLGGRAMNTMEEVLDGMVDQAKSTLLSTQRKFYVSQIERGQIREQQKRVDAALVIWQDALREITNIVEKLQLDVDRQEDVIKEEEEEDKTHPQRLRVRGWKELVHRCYFFIASAHFNLYRKPNEEEGESAESIELTEEELHHKQQEQEYYEKAELLRRELLQDPIRKVKTMTMKLEQRAADQNFVVLDDLMLDENLQLGIETNGLVERFNTVAQVLNSQAEVVDEWREKLVQLLSSKLVDQNADPDGEEYNESLDAQEYAYVYLEVLQQVLSDRSLAVLGTPDPLFTTSNIPQTGKSDKQIELEKERERTQPVEDAKTGMTFRGIISDCRELATRESHNQRAKAERELSQRAMQLMNGRFKKSRDELKELGKEVAVFRDLFNQRVEYYRQLQELSDNVVPLVEYKGDYNSRVEQEEELQKEINQQMGRLRYLSSLDATPREDRLCIICHGTYSTGSWTVCGHEFCRECLTEWWKSHRTCPVCKHKLKWEEVYNFVVGDKNTARRQEVQAEQAREMAKNHQANHHNVIYQDMDADDIRDVERTELGKPNSAYSFGTKIDFIIRHLTWLRNQDATAQVVIFSQWREMLELIERALANAHIQYATVKERMHKFKRDPSIACFLLHAKSQSSGLTLVNATHVYLVEPLVNTALELQAISRIHRIGQRNPTTVWCFVVGNTVEEAVLELSTTKRIANLKTSKVKEIDQRELDKNKEQELSKSMGSMVENGASGGEVVQESDLWTVLFNKN